MWSGDRYRSGRGYNSINSIYVHEKIFGQYNRFKNDVENSGAFSTYGSGGIFLEFLKIKPFYYIDFTGDFGYCNLWRRHFFIAYFSEEEIKGEKTLYFSCNVHL